MHPGSAAQLFLKRAEPQPSVDDCCGNVAEHWIYYAIIAHTRVLVLLMHMTLHVLWKREVTVM